MEKYLNTLSVMTGVIGGTIVGLLGGMDNILHV
ncbi:TPA: holin, partial [Enterococcus faecium]